MFNLVCNSPCFSEDNNKSPFVIAISFISLLVSNTPISQSSKLKSFKTTLHTLPDSPA